MHVEKEEIKLFQFAEDMVLYLYIWLNVCMCIYIHVKLPYFWKMWHLSTVRKQWFGFFFFFGPLLFSFLMMPFAEQMLSFIQSFFFIASILLLLWPVTENVAYFKIMKIFPMFSLNYFLPFAFIYANLSSWLSFIVWKKVYWFFEVDIQLTKKKTTAPSLYLSVTFVRNQVT